MDPITIARLNQINQDFYRTTAAEFDQTRGRSWPGWDRLWLVLRQDVLAGGRESLSVLDVGCGNGRLGLFLADRLATADEIALRYHGMDVDAALLDRAAEALAACPGVDVHLERRDVVMQPPEAGVYDLVALFGVLHHVPGAQTRQDLLRALAARVRPGGLLAFACWRFWEYARFRDRVVPWPDDLVGCVEPGDHLLDWRRGEWALRYCHYVDDEEHAGLVTAAGLVERVTYRADGRSGDANRYSILARA